MKWLAVFVLFAFAVFALYYALVWAGYANAYVRWTMSELGARMGFGAEINATGDTRIVVNASGVYAVRAAVRAPELAVGDFTCVNVANKTWWRHICGPATIQLSPGEYAVAVIRYPSLQASYIETLSAALPAVLLAALALAAYVLYEMRR